MMILLQTTVMIKIKHPQNKKKIIIDKLTRKNCSS